MLNSPRTVFHAIAAITLLACITACQRQTMSLLDEETTAMLERHQARTLGADSQNDPQRVPARDQAPHTNEQSYRTDLPTTNPAPGDLPARPAVEGAVNAIEPPADAVTKMNIEQVLAYAIQHSPDYLAAREDLYLAALDMLAEQHLWGPRFFKTFSAEASGTPAQNEVDHALTLISEFGVTHRLPNGGEVSASALVWFIEALRDDSIAPVPDSQTASLVFALEKPLMRGSGPVARESLIQAQRDLTYEVRNFERFRREFLLRLASDYFDILQSQANIKNLELQLTNFEWLHKRIKALAKAGREPFFEVQRVGQQVLFAKNNVTNAQESHQSTLDAYKVSIGMPPQQNLELLPTQIIVPPLVLDSVESVGTAHRFRLDLQTSADQIDDARRGASNARNGLLPDLDLSASVILPTDPTDTWPGVQIDPHSGAYSVALTYGAAIDRRIERIAYRQSLVTLVRTQRSHTLLRDLITQQVRRSIRRIEQAQFTLEQQKLNIETAVKRSRGVTLNLRALGPRDFIESQEDLLEAQTQYDEAVRDVRVNVLRYLLDTGQMRVDSRGRWLPPAKLAPIEPGPEAPAAKALLKPRANSDLATRQG